MNTCGRRTRRGVPLAGEHSTPSSRHVLAAAGLLERAEPGGGGQAARWSGRIADARSTSSSPAPRPAASAAGIGSAWCARSSALTWSGREARAGSAAAARRRRTTTAAACDVPLPGRTGSSTRAAGVRLVDVRSRGRAGDRSTRPGRPGRPGGCVAAAGERRRRCRRRRSTVPLVSDGADGEDVAGRRRVGRATGWSVPALPAATTTTMPLRQAFSTACVSGSSAVVLDAVGAVGQVEHPDVEPGSSLRCATTQSMAAMTCETSTAPSAVADLDVDELRVGRDAREPRLPSGVAGRRPAMMPAMWVPWPKVSR